MTEPFRRDLRVIIIGAGMSGILTGTRLGEAGIEDFVIAGRLPAAPARAAAPRRVPRGGAARRRHARLQRRTARGDARLSGCRSGYLDRHGTPVTWPWTFERSDADMAAVESDEYELIA
ncbi:MAG: hypothetical protein H6977_17635 [Gammaproteobacteria bacterium]|nr:hypothetical protein [Gammaproteobacteria bacterium]